MARPTRIRRKTDAFEAKLARGRGSDPFAGRAGPGRRSLAAIPVGSKVIYLSALTFPILDTNIVLDPPGPGNNKAFGHVYLDLSTGAGEATFSGGTGVYTWFHASADVSYLGGPNWGWDGMYSFSPGN